MNDIPNDYFIDIDLRETVLEIPANYNDNTQVNLNIPHNAFYLNLICCKSGEDSYCTGVTYFTEGRKKIIKEKLKEQLPELAFREALGSQLETCV